MEKNHIVWMVKNFYTCLTFWRKNNQKLLFLFSISKFVSHLFVSLQYLKIVIPSFLLLAIFFIVDFYPGFFITSFVYHCSFLCQFVMTLELISSLKVVSINLKFCICFWFCWFLVSLLGHDKIILCLANIGQNSHARCVLFTFKIFV